MTESYDRTLCCHLTAACLPPVPPPVYRPYYRLLSCWLPPVIATCYWVGIVNYQRVDPVLFLTRFSRSESHSTEAGE